MNAQMKEGRGTLILMLRRLKSFKFFVIGAIGLNLLLFLSLVWKTMPRTSNISGLPDNNFNDGIQLRNKRYGDKNRDTADIFVGRGVGESSITKQQQHVPATALDYRALDRQNTQMTACGYRTAVYLNNKHIEMNQPPFEDYVKTMICVEGGDIAVFGDKFVKFNNFIIDPTQIKNEKKGGEQMEEVWNQNEDDEYVKVAPGLFKASCSDKPNLTFSQVDHLSKWASVLECYKANRTELTTLDTVLGTTLAIQRYEYVNLYHTMTDFYNAFVLMLIFGIPPSKLNILAVDVHPEGTLDSVWTTLFGKFIRVGRLPKPTVFQSLIWGLLGYFSPLNEHERLTVPYLEDFREFFLSQFNTSKEHVIDCARINVVIIWRRDYVAHPRNPKGSVVRKFDNEDEIVQHVKDILGSNTNVLGLQLDAMLMQDQLQAIAKCDILMGMHGAGLSHILFLPKTSAVIEFKPEYSNPSLLHFKAMATWRNLPYTIWHNFDIANEKASHRTYITKEAIEKTVGEVYSRICNTKFTQNFVKQRDS